MLLELSLALNVCNLDDVCHALTCTKAATRVKYNAHKQNSFQRLHHKQVRKTTFCGLFLVFEDVQSNYCFSPTGSTQWHLSDRHLQVLHNTLDTCTKNFYSGSRKTRSCVYLNIKSSDLKKIRIYIPCKMKFLSQNIGLLTNYSMLQCISFSKSMTFLWHFWFSV